MPTWGTPSAALSNAPTVVFPAPTGPISTGSDLFVNREVWAASARRCVAYARDVDRARLLELGFDVRARAEAGVSDGGAWFATAPDGAPVVLKWFSGEGMADR